MPLEPEHLAPPATHEAPAAQRPVATQYNQTNNAHGHGSVYATQGGDQTIYGAPTQGA
jgi:hypothetical protein